MNATEILRTQDKQQFAEALHARLISTDAAVVAAAKLELRRVVRELIYTRHIDNTVRDVSFESMKYLFCCFCCFFLSFCVESFSPKKKKKKKRIGCAGSHVVVIHWNFWQSVVETTSVHVVAFGPTMNSPTFVNNAKYATSTQKDMGCLLTQCDFYHVGCS